MINAAEQVGHYKHVLAFYLADMQQRRLYQVTGHGSTVHFAEAKLEMDARRTREYIQVGQTLLELDGVRDALVGGELSWSKVIGMLPVVQRETQAAWVDFAKAHTFRELRKEVHACRPGDLPGEGSDYGLVHKRVVIEARLDDVTYAMFERVRMMLSDQPEKPLSDTEVIEELLRRQLNGPAPAKPSPAAEPAPATSEAPAKSGTPPNRDPVPSATEASVYRRDQHACRNCHRPFDLQVHHITPRAGGGSNAPTNLVLLCGTCHASVHRRFLSIHGSPDSGTLHFTSSDGTPVHRPPARPRRAPAAPTATNAPIPYPAPP
ncbi:MAG: HNH endonuclease [Planctomycetota bacterium]